MTLSGASCVADQADPPRPRFDDPAVVEAVRWYVELSTVHGVKPVSPEEDPTRPDFTAFEERLSLMRTGKAAMWTDITSNGISPSLPKDLRLGIVPLPLGEAGMTDWYLGGYYISKDTPYPQQCWAWIKFLSDHGLELVRGLPARRSAAESSQFRAKVGEEAAEAYLFSLERSAGSRPFLETASWLYPSRFWLLEAYGQVLKGTDPESALAEAQRKAEAYIVCLESKEDFADEGVQKACVREVDPDYREFSEEEER